MGEKVICANCLGEILPENVSIRVEDPETKEKVPICSVNCLGEWLLKHPDKLQKESIKKHIPET